MRLKIVAAVSFVLSLVVVYTCAIPNVEATKQPSFKLAEGAPIKVGPMAGEPVIADCNQDGNLDIILACGTCCGSQPSPESGHVQVLLGNGRGQFTRAQGSPIPIGPSARKVAVGDGNSDGHVDIFVAQHDSYEVVMLTGNGKGEFKPAPDSPFIAAKGTRPHTHDITTGDVNGDSKLDLLTTNANDNTISILLGDGKGKFVPAPNSPLSAGRHPYDVVRLADVNHDSKMDMVTPNLRGNAVTVMLGDGAGAFAKTNGSPFALHERPGYVAVGDVNKDGKLDLIASHDDYPIVDILLGDGTGQFKLTPESPLKPRAAVWGISIADVNSDGNNDLVMGAQRDEGITIMLGDGKGGFVEAANSQLPAGKFAGYVAVADFNKDGKTDIVANSYSDGQVYVYLNTTAGKTSTANAKSAGTANESLAATGHRAPDFAVKTLDQRLLRLADLRGKVVVLDFMASWCGKCIETLPHLKALKDRFRQQDLEIISISLDGGETTDTTINDLNHLLATQNVNWPVVFDDTGWDNAVARNYGINALPVHIVIDQLGIIRAVSNGAEKAELEKLNRDIEQLLRKHQ